MNQVTFRAYPTWTCDVSFAEEGETALLFLTRMENGTYEIVNSGNGRWRLNPNFHTTQISVSEYDLMDPSERKHIKDWSMMSRTRLVDLSYLKQFLQRSQQ